MVEMYAHFPVVMWIIDALIWALGVFFWVFTYIAAPLESRKKGYTVSGTARNVFFLIFSGRLFISEQVADVDFSVGYQCYCISYNDM